MTRKPGRPAGVVNARETVVRKLFEEADRQGLTIAQLELRSGVASETIKRLRNGRAKRPTIYHVRKLALALGFKVGIVLNKKAPQKEKDAPLEASEASSLERHTDQSVAGRN